MSKINYYLGKKILIIESSKEDVNKTWCFWDNNDSKWNNFLSKKWSEVNFKSSDVSLDFKLHDMTYNMIKSQDFLNHKKVYRIQMNVETLMTKFYLLIMSQKM